MSADTAAGGSRTVALARGKAGVHASVNGDAPQLFALRGVDATTLAEALSVFNTGLTTVLLIGTRDDGEPGWDEVDEDSLVAATSHEVLVLSEAQALSLDPELKEPAAWLIMATAVVDGLNSGSVRWWVQDADGVVTLANVQFLNKDYGQISLHSGAGSPTLMAGMVEAIISNHPHIRRVYVWSADGQSGGEAYRRGDHTQPDGSFWKNLKLPGAYVEDGGDVVVVPDPMAALTIASGNGIPKNI